MKRSVGFKSTFGAPPPSKSWLPRPTGGKEGSWLKVSFELDTEGEKKQREKIEGLLDKLKKKSKE